VHKSFFKTRPALRRKLQHPQFCLLQPPADFATRYPDIPTAQALAVQRAAMQAQKKAYEALCDDTSTVVSQSAIAPLACHRQSCRRPFIKL
jgi:hypothetical protein